MYSIDIPNRLNLIFSIIILIGCNTSNVGTLTTDTVKKNALDNKSLSASNDTTQNDTLKQGIFIIDNVKFRYLIIDYRCAVDKFENGHWSNNLSITYSSRTDTLIADVNNDGYNDIVNSWKWYTEAYLYNKNTKLFNTAHVGLSNEWDLIDSAKNIFCDEKNIKGNEEASTLYTFDSLKRKILYSIKFITKEVPEEDFPIITSMELYKNNFEDIGSNPILINATNVDKDYEFDYIKYWTLKYKKLLTNR